jgi:hypothetical protein
MFGVLYESENSSQSIEFALHGASCPKHMSAKRVGQEGQYGKVYVREPRDRVQLA